MMRKAEPPLPRQIVSDPAIWFSSIAAGIAVFALAIFLQWLIYDDWMHRGGLRIVGSALAIGRLLLLLLSLWGYVGNALAMRYAHIVGSHR